MPTLWREWSSMKRILLAIYRMHFPVLTKVPVRTKSESVHDMRKRVLSYNFLDYWWQRVVLSATLFLLTRWSKSYNRGCIEGDNVCWCMKLPTVPKNASIDEYDGCLCPSCLKVYSGDKKAIIDDVLERRK